MAALQQMMAQMGAGGGGPGGPMDGMMGGPGGPMGMGMPSKPKDDPNAEHKKWIALYPIYIDAKRPYGKGCRRVAYDKSCLFPTSLHIARALHSLGIRFVHEEWKTHPKDWENPGRVKAKIFNEDWQSTHATIKTSEWERKLHRVPSWSVALTAPRPLIEKQLIEAVAKEAQASSGGRPPALPKLKQIAEKAQKKRDERLDAAEKAAAAAAAGPANAAAGKKKATEGQQSSTPAASKKVLERRRAKKVAIDPLQARRKKIAFPPADRRLPPHSPAVEGGLLNMDMPGAMANAGALAGNPMASMLGSLMGGGDDADEEEDEEAEKQRQLLAAKNQPKDPMAGLSRRQKKRVVRVGR